MAASAAKIARLTFCLAVLAGMTVSLGACNTTEGFGKDVQNTGSSIKHSAQDNKPQ
ncbi:MAG TPA: entericidin A/B family lipoprotein [Stellaceae bacterium]|jgi:predicted small secreted protein|nr:entericidin A/B family lipoprotein [Stellaceae bacterium]